MPVKKNNHLLPRMVIKRWEEYGGKIYDKELDQIREVEQLDYSKEYYYSLGKVDDELENKISIFEGYVGNILKKLNENDDSVELLEKEMELLKLYAYLQTCRNDNTSSVINNDESGIYKNNNYLFGVPLVSTPKEAVELTNIICKEFERIRKLDNNTKYSYNYNFMSFENINSCLLMGLHLVIVTNPNKSFIVSETTAVIECSLDSDYMFTFVPVSPKIGLILAKSKYFYSKEEIEYTKERFGRKYGSGIPDPYISEIISDYKLIFNGKPLDGNKVLIQYNLLNEEEIYNLNSIIYEDGHKILFCSKDHLDKAKFSNPIRKVILG